VNGRKGKIAVEVGSEKGEASSLEAKNRKLGTAGLTSRCFSFRFAGGFSNRGPC